MFLSRFKFKNVKDVKIQYLCKSTIINTYKNVFQYLINIFIFTPLILGFYQYFIDIKIVIVFMTFVCYTLHIY